MKVFGSGECELVTLGFSAPERLGSLYPSSLASVTIQPDSIVLYEDRML